MIYIERKKNILKTLEEKGVVSIKEISAELATSEITIRRDFEKLENEGFLTRVSGGAVLNDNSNASYDNVELSVKQKKIQNEDKKKKVAEATAELIKEGNCIFIDCGTCMIPLIKILAKRNITIVTNNITILQYLRNPIAEVFVIGGRYNSIYEMNAGSTAEEYMKTFHFDISILGCAGIDLGSGDIYTSALDGYTMKKTALEQCDSSILILDSTKLSKKSLVKISNIKNINHIICDNDIENKTNKFPKNFIFV